MKGHQKSLRLTLFFLLFGLLAIFLIAFFYFDLARFITISRLQQHARWFASCTQHHYVWCVSMYILLFSFIIACSLPLTGPLTLLGGFLFGVAQGSLFSVLAATAGCTIAFLLLRKGMHEVANSRYHKYTDRLSIFNKNIARYGVSYLLIMHFSTIVPYAFINVLAAMANISLATVVWTTAIGFIPTALVYTFASSRLLKISSMSDIFSFKVMLAFVLLILLALVPIFIRRIFRGKKL